MNPTCMNWNYLSPHDQIEIVAPASGTRQDKLEAGLSWMRSHGLVPQYPADMIKTDLFFAAPLAQQWEQFKAAFYSEAKVIWCLRGGYGSMRLLPFLETLTPPKTPKLIIGFSDITSLHIFFNQKWNWPTLHGRTVTQLDPSWERNEEHQQLIDVLFGKIQELSFSQLLPLNQAARENRTLESRVVGGNLRLLQSSLGTPWQINPKGKILFIEDVSERGYSVDRMLEQMWQAKLLDEGLDALLIGDFSDGLEKNGENLVPAALERFASRVSYPVLRGMPCGHAPGVNSPLPFNTPSTLSLGEAPRLVCQLMSMK
jgi:muramoyltetrapeptide carboxypeptidase